MLPLALSAIHVAFKRVFSQPDGLRIDVGGLSELHMPIRTQVYLLLNVYIPSSARLRLFAVIGRCFFVVFVCRTLLSVIVCWLGSSFDLF